jgi:hypothetical protein
MGKVIGFWGVYLIENQPSGTWRDVRAAAKK